VRGQHEVFRGEPAVGGDEGIGRLPQITMSVPAP